MAPASNLTDLITNLDDVTGGTADVVVEVDVVVEPVVVEGDIAVAGWAQGVSPQRARTHGGSSVRHASWPWLL